MPSIQIFLPFAPDRQKYTKLLLSGGSGDLNKLSEVCSLGIFVSIKSYRQMSFFVIAQIGNIYSPYAYVACGSDEHPWLFLKIKPVSSTLMGLERIVSPK